MPTELTGKDMIILQLVIPMNIYWYMLKFNLKNTVYFRVILFMRAFSAFLFRICGVLAALFYIVASIGGSQSALIKLYQLPALTQILLTLNVTLFTSANLLWSYQMIRSYALNRKNKTQ
jgi:hypothetical protein